MMPTVDALSRGRVSQGDWTLHPEVVRMIWRTYGTAVVNVFADSQTSHYRHWFSPRDEPGSLGLDALAHDWPDRIIYAFHLLPLIWRTRVSSA